MLLSVEIFSTLFFFTEAKEFLFGFSRKWLNLRQTLFK